jgi:hypothetical protein
MRLTHIKAFKFGEGGIMRKRNLLSLAIAVLAASMGTQVSAGIVTIDTFDQTTQSLDFDPPQETPVPASSSVFDEMQTEPGEAIGGYRDMFIRTDNEIASSDNGQATVVSNLGEVQVSNTGNASIVVEFTWDGMDNSADVDTNGLGGIDLTMSGLNDGFLVGNTRTDIDVNLQFNLWDSTGAIGSIGRTFQQDTNGEDVFFAYNELSNQIDLANIGAIQLVITGPEAYDLQFDLLQSTTLTGPSQDPAQPPTSVSSPATLALVSAGLFGLGFTRRNKRS